MRETEFFEITFSSGYGRRRTEAGSINRQAGQQIESTWHADIIVNVDQTRGENKKLDMDEVKDRENWVRRQRERESLIGYSVASLKWILHWIGSHWSSLRRYDARRCTDCQTEIRASVFWISWNLSLEDEDVPRRKEFTWFCLELNK
jgi:hypothetical protein